MAADDERPSEMKMTDRGVKKLLPGEKVEVLYYEEGLKGSWHIGAVTGCGRFSRTVELVHLLNEDNSSKLVDSIPVSAAIEGLRRNAPKRHRNGIRPLPPTCKIKEDEIRYGLCVDAFVDDAWWEGVVFDHHEGSSERLILFPDQGDQQAVSFQKLRRTQEWNEASGLWKHRGDWAFLQIIQYFEREGPLPVSVREIWYDLRSTASFLGMIGLWIYGSKSIWYELVSELIQELISVVNDLPVKAALLNNELCETPVNTEIFNYSMKFLPVPDGNPLPETVGVNSGLAVPGNNTRALLDPNDMSSLHIASRENHVNRIFFHEGSQVQASREHFLIFSSGNRTDSMHHSGPHLKKCSYLLNHASIDPLHYDSNGKVHDGCEEIAKRKRVNSSFVCKKSGGKRQRAEIKDNISGITSSGSSEAWHRMDLEAENCDEAISLYLDYLKDEDFQPRILKSRAKKISSLRLKAKRHLVALGWVIKVKRVRGRLSVRFVSPKGQCYNSLHSACFCLLGRQEKPNGRLKCSNLKSTNGHFVSSSYELSMNFGSETVRDSAFNKVEKKNQFKDSTKVSELNVSNGDTNAIKILKMKCTSRKTKCNGISNSVMNDKSRCEKRGLVIEASKRESYKIEDIEPGDFPGAVNQYLDWYTRGGTAKKQSVGNVNLLKLNSKKHLLFLGWRLLKTKSALYYVSPSGKAFRSLYSACKTCLEEENSEVGTSRSLLNEKIRRRLEYLSREMKPKKLSRRVCCCAKTIADESFHEAFQALQNRVEEKHSDSSKIAESAVCSFTQMLSKENRGCKKRSMTSACQSLNNDKLMRHSSNCSSACAKSEKRRKLSVVKKRHSLTSISPSRGRRTSKRSREVDVLSPSQHASRTVLSLLIENDVVLPRQKVMYIHETDGHVMMEGRITREGIKCKCCSKVHTLSSFETHAGSTLRRPAANIHLKDGRSLLQCQIQMLSSKVLDGVQRPRLKSDCSIYQSDNICSVCHDGGSLILCDHCPSSFHLDCVGLEDVPETNWFCPSCSCHICGLSEFNPDTEQFTDKTVLHCDQCEHEYHVGCVRETGCKSLQSCPPGNWFCSEICSKIFLDLRTLVGISKPTTVEGFSCTILRSGRDYRAGCDQFDSEVMVEHNSKLFVALKVLHECFVTIIEPRTKSDLVCDILFNKESELKRLNFYGFYTMLLEKGDELVSVATFRIYGEKIAEMPLVGTRIQYRRQGMCRLLVGELEKVLVSIGVEKFVLPAVPQLLETWTTSFGFAKMSNAERMNILKYSVLNFQDTTMCQKTLKIPSPAHCKPKDNSSSNIGANILELADHELILALPCFRSDSSPVVMNSGTDQPSKLQRS